MLYYVYFSDEGVAKTGLTPTWECFGTSDNGTSKTGPAISEISSTNAKGWYKFTITLGDAPWDVSAEDLSGVIDGGNVLANVDRYKPISITKRGLALNAIMQNLDSEATALASVNGHVRIVDGTGAGEINTNAGKIAFVENSLNVGTVTGHVQGNVNGNLIGNVEGVIAGNILGDMLGDITGSITGDIDVVTDVLSILEADVILVTSTTPWQLQYKIKDTATILFKKALKDTGGANITATGSIVGQHIHTA